MQTPAAYFSATAPSKWRRELHPVEDDTDASFVMSKRWLKSNPRLLVFLPLDGMRRSEGRCRTGKRLRMERPVVRRPQIPRRRWSASHAPPPSSTILSSTPLSSFSRFCLYSLRSSILSDLVRYLRPEGPQQVMWSIWHLTSSM
jgi:hypothetical protein